MSSNFGSPSRGDSDDYYGADRLRRDWKNQNPGENFQKFLNKSEKKSGISADPIREGLTPKAERKASRPQPKSDRVTILPTKKSAAKAGLPKKPAPKKK